MKLAVLFLLLSCSGPALGDDASPRGHDAPAEAPWSKDVNGLRGRLQVLPPAPGDHNYCRIILELENTVIVLGERTIRFSAGKISVQVIDHEGKPLKVAPNAYSGMSPIWEPLRLPYGATMRFPVNLHGLAHGSGLREYIIDMGAMNSWIVPTAGEFYLKAKLTIKKEDGPDQMDWSGTLDFPKVEIPRPK